MTQQARVRIGHQWQRCSWACCRERLRVGLGLAHADRFDLGPEFAFRISVDRCCDRAVAGNVMVDATETALGFGGV